MSGMYKSKPQFEVLRVPSDSLEIALLMAAAHVRHMGRAVWSVQGIRTSDDPEMWYVDIVYVPSLVPLVPAPTDDDGDYRSAEQP